MSQKWFKYTYVCSNCDSLWEITTSQSRPPYTPHYESVIGRCSTMKVDEPICNGVLNFLSVVDATIYPTPEKKEEEVTESFNLIDPTVYNPEAKITIIVDEVTNETSQITALDVVSLKKSLAQRNAEISKNRDTVRELRDLLLEAYDESEDKDLIIQIANLFRIELIKEIEFSAVINVSGTVEVDITDGRPDIYDLVYQELSVDGSGSVQVNNYEVESAEKGAY